MDDDQTISVSKGVFVSKNNFKRPQKGAKRKTKSPPVNPLFSSDLWYITYSKLWSRLEESIEELNHDMFSEVQTSLVKFVKESHNVPAEEIPTACLLTGINMPDHEAQFSTLTKQLKSFVSPHVATLSSQDCQNIKYLMENMVHQFVNDGEDEDDKPQIKKAQLNITLLQSWYEQLYREPLHCSPKKHKTKNRKNVLVVILPDFESFNVQVLQRFILISSWYTKVLPFVFIFGIATSMSTLHKFLPYHVSSKISLKLFNSQPSTVYLNKILENVFFNMHCPFNLGSKVFGLFTDIFLFYDLSVSNFVQNIKFVMLEHFCYGNAMALCDLDRKVTNEIVNNFDHNDFENVRRLLSFRELVENESHENRIKLLTDDVYFREILKCEIVKIQKYVGRLHMFLRCLLILVGDLPKAPLGKQFRELYSTAVRENITKTSEYKECFQLLGFQSKEELSLKLRKIVDYLSTRVSCGRHSKIGQTLNELELFLKQINTFNMAELEDAVNDIEKECEVDISGSTGRREFKEKLLELSKQSKPRNRYEKLRHDILGKLSETFEEHLMVPKTFYFHEIFFFDDISVKNQIVGSHRAAIHNALTDPQYYLKCDCCAISNSSLLRPFMPDICVAYKLHLECGKVINLYDWLQAFVSIVDPKVTEDDDEIVISEKLHARFTQAVGELEYLGFIKSYKRKTDHVMRLTWGG